MKRLIYTAVFGGYDRVYPPVTAEPDVDYVIFTEQTDLRVPGWRTVPVDMSRFSGPSAANRYYKTMIHVERPDCDLSLYIDGNIRLLGTTRPLFERFASSGKALALHAHPLRTRVADEIETVIASGKSADPDALRSELSDYTAQGFPDADGLTENTVMLKNHRHPGLDEAMRLWWGLYERYLSRDQVSLPYVIWKTGLPVHFLPGSFRDPNPYFAIYPHAGARGVNPSYAHVAARAHDSRGYRVLLGLWRAKWAVQRWLRGVLR